MIRGYVYLYPTLRGRAPALALSPALAFAPAFATSLAPAPAPAFALLVPLLLLCPRSSSCSCSNSCSCFCSCSYCALRVFGASKPSPRIQNRIQKGRDRDDFGRIRPNVIYFILYFFGGLGFRVCFLFFSGGGGGCLMKREAVTRGYI